MKYSDEMLMAYIDRELDGETTASIDAAVMRDPALAARVERQRTLAGAVHAAFEPVLQEPMPKRLLDAASGATSAARPSRARRWTWLEWAAMAASVVAGVVIGGFLVGDFRRAPAAEIAAERGRMIARGELAHALSEQLASSQRPDGRVRIGLTFVSKGGEYCRTFLLEQSGGLACSADGEWQVQMLTHAAAAATPSAYRTASVELPPEILHAVEKRIQGTSLDAAAERAAQRSGWRR